MDGSTTDYKAATFKNIVVNGTVTNDGILTGLFYTNGASTAVNLDHIIFNGTFSSTKDACALYAYEAVNQTTMLETSTIDVELYTAKPSGGIIQKLTGGIAIVGLTADFGLDRSDFTAAYYGLFYDVPALASGSTLTRTFATSTMNVRGLYSGCFC